MAFALPRSFYERPTVDVARDLLERTLVRRMGDEVLRARIVEVEAYLGRADPGSHAFRGPTRRTQVMFGPAGHLYVYVSYGMHHCMNIVTEGDGIAGAVLVRALEPLDGLHIMRERRRKGSDVELCNGPGKLCEALGISLQQNGFDLTGNEIWLEEGDAGSDLVAVTTRIGLSQGTDLPLRFFLPDNPYVSRGKPSGGPSLSHRLSGGR